MIGTSHQVTQTERVTRLTKLVADTVRRSIDRLEVVEPNSETLISMLDAKQSGNSELQIAPAFCFVAHPSSYT